MTALSLLIHGASGRMGRSLLRLAASDPRFHIAAAATGRGGVDLDGHAPVFAAAELGRAPPFSIAIDFSQPEGFDAVLALCVERRCGLVSGTTGLSSSQLRDLDAAGATIPVLWAANFSLGVAVLTELVRQASAALPGWDSDILEAHHRHKKDAPSGTALHLGAAVTAGRGQAPNYSSVRAGDIVGEHTVQLVGPGERLELIHRAGDREIFARGALETALRLAGQPPGRRALGELLLGTSPG